MTNLIEIFQFLNDYEPKQIKENFQSSRNYFLARNRMICAEMVRYITEVHNWYCELSNDSGYTLSDGTHRVNFLLICQSISTKQVSQMHGNIKAIRAEMLSVTTAESLDEFKKLNQFWESLELSLQVMME